MNIWDWISKLQNDLYDAGQAHNANIINDLSSHVADQEVAKADALLPEVKALANTLDNPWLSVYTGHWQMRNSLGNKAEGESALGEAVRLFELAHREDTQDCPQSICITQDLAACYGNIDGAGWADDRIAVCDETLSRIDPSWSCYVCLSSEKALAHIDKKNFVAARDVMDSLCDDLAEYGEDRNGMGINDIYNAIDLHEGNYEAALDRIIQEENQPRDYPEWQNISQPRSIQKVHALSRLGRHDEALETLPALNDVPIGKVSSWLNAIFPTLMHDASYNTWHLAQNIKPALTHLSEHGSHRLAIDMALQCAKLAIARQARFIAHHYALIAQSHLPKLKLDAGASEQVQQLMKEIENMAVTPLPVPADELTDWLNQGSDNNNHHGKESNDEVNNNEENSDADTDNATTNRNPETELEWLMQALDEQLENADLVHQTASALEACGLDDDAYQVLWRFVQDHPQHDSQTQFILLDTLINEANDTHSQAQVDALCALYADSDPAFVHWGQARLANQQDDHASTEAECRKLLALQPNAKNATSLLSHSLMQQQRFGEAAEYYLALYDMDTDYNGYAWDYMTAVSSAKNWQKLYDMAGRLGLDMDATDDKSVMPEENWGWVIIRHVQNNQALEYYAQRLGPTHARILENAPSKFPQVVGDIVTFDAQPLYPKPEDDEAAQHFMYTYRAVHTLESGGYGRSWLLDGIAPTDEAYDSFKAECDVQGYRVWWHSRDYQVTDSLTETEHAGMIASIAAPASTPISEIVRFVQTQTQAWEHPICYYDLAKQAGVDLDEQQGIIERYGL